VLGVAEPTRRWVRVGLPHALAATERTGPTWAAPGRRGDPKWPRPSARPEPGRAGAVASRIAVTESTQPTGAAPPDKVEPILPTQAPMRRSRTLGAID